MKGFGRLGSVSVTVYNNVVLITGGVETDDVRKKVIKDVTESGLATKFIDRMTLEKETGA